jgi:hypothetical protein
VICALLVIAGAHKVLRPRAARESLSLVGIHAPGLAVRALGAVEVALGVVAAGWPSVITGTLVAVLYGAFCVFVVVLLVQDQGAATDCGCFGGGEHTAGWLHVALNAVACVIAVTGTVAGAHGLGWILSRPPLVAPSLVIGMLAATYAAYLAYTLVPRAWASYGTEAAR